jgi:hypothetical protein
LPWLRPASRYGPVLARVSFERAEVTDEFIASVVEHWLAAAPEAPA